MNKPNAAANDACCRAIERSHYFCWLLGVESQDDLERRYCYNGRSGEFFSSSILPVQRPCRWNCGIVGTACTAGYGQLPVNRRGLQPCLLGRRRTRVAQDSGSSRLPSPAGREFEQSNG